MTDISKKIEEVLKEFEEFYTKQEPDDWRRLQPIRWHEPREYLLTAITNLIEEERAGWVERVAKEVEAVAPVITKLKSVDDELVLVVSDFPDADVIYLYEKDVVALIRNSKEADASL